MTKLPSNPPLEAALKHIASLVGQARDRSFRAANTELVHLYWSVGQYLSQQCQHEGWGQGTVKTLAQLLQTREPGWKGFSAQNLWRMKQFLDAYEGDEELSTALRVLHPGPAQVFKDTYLVDFLALPPDHKEDDLQRGLVTKLKLFLTELGRYFCFAGEQFRLQVGIFAAGQAGGAVCNGTAGRGCG